MRYAILADIHGNVTALRAVLQDMQQISSERDVRFDQVWCLGDVVGYGPEPGECVRLIRSRSDVCIPGNHDWAAVKKLDLADFSAGAAASAEWTRDHLAPDERKFLQSLPDRTRIGHFTLAHGSPSNPIWEYLINPASAAANFAAFDSVFCVVGHTHVPTIFMQAAGAAPRIASPVQATPRHARESMELPGGPSWHMLEDAPQGGAGPRCERMLPKQGLWVLPPGYRAIINPGSVGQPRDGDPRAAYMIYDSDVGFEFRRVDYDIAATQRNIRAAGLSAKLADRLARGV